MATGINVIRENKKVSMPRIFMHAEGIALLLVTLILYAKLDFNWGTFAILLFTPDLPMILYVMDKRTGSIAYNLVHTIIFPLILAYYSYSIGNSVGIQLSLIWLAHIGMDHCFGYGFKYLGQMKETHFSRV